MLNRVEIDETKKRKITENQQKSKVGFLKRTKLTNQEKREETQSYEIRNQRGDMIVNPQEYKGLYGILQTITCQPIR